ncbi:sterol desaturase family protein [Pseudovibrio denitrificans]|uniref:sterol desaturase family protein n=1 Tax=Pseudovibrio denitrificans TaxID=258256 RepID=UPI0039BFE3FD
MAEYNITALAIPLFLFFMLIEYAYLRLSGRDLHRFSDNIASLSMGICLLVSDALLKTFTFSVFIWAWSSYRLFDFGSASWVTWVVFFFGVDFCYYWFHRIAHTYNFLWGAHVGHHQSEEYNLTTALRQSAFQYAFSWVFYLPLAFLGCPPEVFLIQFMLLKAYQFWLHTQAIDRIPLMEGVFSTPSSHRVHHAKNPIYIDKNFGGTLVIWDRMFGSWQPEVAEHPCHYGTTTPLKTWNPVKANLQHWSMLFRDSLHTESWWDKVRLWFKPTGWRPEDRRRVSNKLQKTGVSNRPKFDPIVSSTTKLYCGVSFALLVLLVTMFIFLSPQLSARALAFGVLLILAGLVMISQFLEGKFQLRHVEVVRVPALLWFLAVLWTLPISTQVSQRLDVAQDASPTIELSEETTLSALPWLEKPAVLDGSTPAVQQVTWHPDREQGQLEYTLRYELSSFPEHVANILSGRSALEESSRLWLQEQL